MSRLRATAMRAAAVMPSAIVAGAVRSSVSVLIIALIDGRDQFLRRQISCARGGDASELADNAGVLAKPCRRSRNGRVEDFRPQLSAIIRWHPPDAIDDHSLAKFDR